MEELMYTDPETANDFVRNTKVDSLAVAVGTAHGKYKSTPKLDINRLDQIRKSRCPISFTRGIWIERQSN